jgi:hypothetical protein
MSYSSICSIGAFVDSIIAIEVENMKSDVVWPSMEYSFRKMFSHPHSWPPFEQY